MVAIIFILIIIIYSALPIPIQLVLFAVNMFLPDPIPMLDEVIMVISMANKAKLLSKLYDLLQKHRVIGIIVIAIIIAGIITGIVYSVKTLISFL